MKPIIVLKEEFYLAENPNVYVEDFSGTTPQAKIQAAIDFASQNARKTVIAADKDYYITGTVIIKQGVKLQGSYGTRFVIGANVRGFELQKDASFWDASIMVDYNGYTKEVIYLDGKYNYYNTWNNTSLKNLILLNWTGTVSGTWDERRPGPEPDSRPGAARADARRKPRMPRLRRVRAPSPRRRRLSRVRLRSARP